MTAFLRYGNSAVLKFDSLKLDSAADSQIVDCSVPRGEPIADLLAAVQAAISQPLDFPPLVLATVPGDKVVLALDSAVPCPTGIVAPIVEALTTHGIEPTDIHILSNGSLNHTLSDPRSELPVAIRQLVEFSIHNPNNADEHCHLANRADGEEVRIQRRLFDADVVVPIGCLRGTTAWGYYGIHTGIFPAFGDAASQKLFRVAAADAHGRKKKNALVEEIAWELGITFTVQVIPGGGEKALHVLAGEPRSVARRGAELFDAAWKFHIDAPAELVILGLTGDPSQQTWDNVARSLVAALPLVSSDGALVAVTELAEPPGEAIRMLADRDDLSATRRRMKKKQSPDVPAAAQLARILEQSKVFLASQLSEEAIEDLGIAHVANPADVARLARRTASCLIVSSAQFAHGRVGE